MIYIFSAFIIALVIAGVDFVISGGHFHSEAVIAAFIAALIVGLTANKK